MKKSVVVLFFLFLWMRVEQVEALSGDGTPQNPYIITTCAELQTVKDKPSASYELGSNIDCTASATWNSGKGFVPIGNATTKFTGTFNGKGYTISNLTIKRPTEQYIGLFGYAEGANVLIQNVTLSTPSILGGTAYVGTLIGYAYTGVTVKNINVLNGTFNAGDIAGGIIGYFRGTLIDQVNVRLKMVGDEYLGGIVGYLSGGVGATISHSSYEGQMDGTAKVGGISGYVISGSTITQSYSKGTINGLTSPATGQIGGVVGHAKASTFKDSFSFMNVSCPTTCSATVGSVGGFIGQMDSGTIDTSYSTGSVTTNVATKGGFVGNLLSGSITNAFWDKTTSGLATSPGGSGKTTSELKQISTYANWNFDTTWLLDAALNSGYPIVPTRSSLLNVSESHTHATVQLSWMKPADTFFSSATIIKNGVKVASNVSATSYQDTQVVPKTSYVYTLFPVYQDGTIGSVTKINAKTNGFLALVAPTVTPFPSIVLNGKEQRMATSFSTPLQVEDTTNGGKGWNVTVQATPFKEVGGSGYVLPKGSLTVHEPLAYTPKNQASTLLPQSLGTAPWVIDNGSAVKIMTAALNEGMGEYAVTFPTNALEVTIRPETKTIDAEYGGIETPYESTITWTILAGP